MLPAMTATQQYTLSIAPVDRKGKPAPVDGVPVWASSNEAVARVTPQGNGLSAIVTAQGVGEYTISVAADADMSEFIQAITATDSGVVTLGTAVALGFTASPVTEQESEPAPPVGEGQPV